MINLEGSYRNPFSDYNANVMNPSKILDYWCSPFAKSTAISESDIYLQGIPIVFMGGRGTGKTMFLRYFSYYVQRDEALKKIRDKDSKKIITYLKERGGIGFYLRIDGPVLRSFDEKGLEQKKWDAIFVHYFELQVCKSYIEVIQDLVIKGELNKENVEKEFIPEVDRRLGITNRESKTIEDLLERIEDELNIVTTFRAQIAFSDVDFRPTKGFASQDLSFGVAEIAKRTIDDFKEGINFVILIDEYENFIERQQRIINTLLKFVKQGITFRIGMRLQGFHTFDTISENEFIKEDRDYTKVTFENFLINEEEYKKFLIDVAKKRLESVAEFKNKGFIDISKFLGEKEDIETEAKNLIESRENPFKHFELLKFAQRKIDVDEVTRIIDYKENPLLEMLNILWVIRGNKPEDVRKTMLDYIEGKKTKEVKKYKGDYINKYKLSLMILLQSVYKKHKMYYSFNTFSFLSSGIVGHFIELCRRSFQYAYFENREKLLEEGIISLDLQDKAAHDLANSEIEMVQRIPKFGDSLYRFTKNIGNIFREYHLDPYVRYPETNQFSVDISSIDDDNLRKAFDAALEWSIVQNKIGTQIYSLNRIFSPKFDISYRTRGGEHGEKNYNKSHLKALMTEENVKPLMKLERKKAKETTIKEPDTKIQTRFDFYGGLE